jgi:hypothetical protein
VLSQPAVRSVLDRFVCIKVDARNPDQMAPTRMYKATRYVPEVVLLSPKGKVLSRLEARDVDGVVDELQEALDKAERWARQ